MMCRILFDGLILSFFCTLIILISLRVNPRLWLQDYPKEIQELVPAKSKSEKNQSLIWGIPFLLILILIPFFSTLGMKRAASTPLPFWMLVLNASGVAFVFNLVDLILIDWLIFCTFTPRFAVIPGTEGSAGYKNYGFHFRAFLIGTVASIIIGLLIATVVFLL